MSNRSTSYEAKPVHLALDQRFYTPVGAASFPMHVLRFRNDRAAASVGLERLDDQSWINHFGKFTALPNNIETPLALCYHGHQFGHYNPELGDGRGFLFAQMRGSDGRILDLGTKGSGQTPFSRTADGRLTLKGAVREILATEMLEALGVNTSKTLSVIETGEALHRNDEPSPTRSAVLVRLSHSHIRIGTFQRLRFLDDREGLEMLSRHTARHYFDGQLNADDDLEVLVPALLNAVSGAVATTAGAWLAAGFVHGVLNTDNFNVTGESFDYGPWRFLPYFDPGFTAAYFDQTARYAYGRQADACMWALCRLADCFTKFCDEQTLESQLHDFYPKMETALATSLARRLGVVPTRDLNAGQELCRQFFHMARASQVGFDQLLHDFWGGKQRRGNYAPDTIAGFADCLSSFVPADNFNHAYFNKATALSMTINEVEAIWDPIADSDDWSTLYQKIDAIREMGAALSL